MAPAGSYFPILLIILTLPWSDPTLIKGDADREYRNLPAERNVVNLLNHDGRRFPRHVARLGVVAGDEIELGRLRELQLPEIESERLSRFSRVDDGQGQ